MPASSSHRLDVDDDVALRAAPRWTAASTASATACPWPTAAPGATANHDVGKVAPGRVAHPQPADVDRRLDPRDRLARRLGGLRGSVVHEHVDVPPDQPHRREEDEARDEQRRQRVAVRIAGGRRRETGEDRGRAEQVAAEVERVRLQRRAPEAPGRAQRDRRAARVDGDHDTSTRTSTRPRRPPTRAARQPGDGEAGDEQAQGDQDRRLSQRGEVLRLPVAVLVGRIGRPHCDSDREQREQSRDKVRSRMEGLREQPERAAREPGYELQQ